MIRKLIFAITFSLASLIVNAQLPTVTSFSPTNGSIGDQIVITGTNFNLIASNNIVLFGNAVATVNTATATSLTVSVPVGSTFGPIRVLNKASNLVASSTAFFTPTFTPSKTSILAADYSTNTDFATNANPNAVSLADLDGDGKIDMVAANSGSANVSVYRNTGSTGTIAFATKQDFTTGTSPLAVITTDIDGDGLVDIITANSTGNSISVLRNTSTNGNISFATKIDLSAANGSGSVVAGDFDNDGKMDIASANKSANSISVFRNIGSTGNILFDAKLDFTTGTNPNSIAVGDIDGDGKIEIAVANKISLGAGSISVFRNSSSPGSISFAPKLDFTAGADASSISIGDLDGDSKLDIITQNWNPGTASAFRNTSTSGTITFAAKFDFGVFGSGFSMVLADTNGDAKVDAVATHTTTNTLGNLKNSSTVGNFSFGGTAGFTTGTNPQGVAVADIDGDGLPDFVCANNGSNTVRIYRSIPTAPSGPPVITSFSPATANAGTTITISGSNFNASAIANNTVYFGSVKATILSVGSNFITAKVPVSASTSKITVTNNTTGLSGTSSKSFITTFSPSANRVFGPRLPLTAAANTLAVTVGDFDNDGLPDIASVNSGTGSVSVFKNNSTLGVLAFATKQDFTITSNVNATNKIIASDIDGDTKLDLIISSGLVNVTVLLNTSTAGNISFATPFTVSAGTGFVANSVAVADMDGDGKQDLVVSNSSGSTGFASVFRNTSTIGNLSFSVKFNAATYTSSVSAIETGDLNADAKPDIIILNGPLIATIPNNSTSGSLAFGASASFASGSSVPLGLAVGDMNADGLPEIAICSSSDISTIKTHPNTSTGGVISFGAVLSPNAVAGSNSVIITDFDGDGIPDFGVASVPAGASGFTKNNSTGNTFSFANPFQASGTPLFSTTSLAAVDFDGDSKPDHVVNDLSASRVCVFRNISSNANLSNITVSAGTLTPVFVASTISYRDTVSSVTTSIQFTPTVEDTTASIQINGTAITNNTLSAAIPLNIGNNTITILVTAENGSTKTYTIIVNRLNNLPSVSLGAFPAVCQGATTANLTYSTPISSPITYSITWNTAALSAGLLNVTDINLPSSPIILTIPANIADAVYNGTLVVKNATNSSNPIAFTITVNAKPVVAAITGVQQVCIGATTSFSNSTTGGVWSSGNTAIATTNTAGVITPITAGTATINYTVTNTSGCTTVVTRDVTVNAQPLPTAITGPTSVCQLATITLSNAASGGVWSTNNTAIATVNASGLVTAVGSGTVTINYLVTNANNCSINNTASVTVLAQPVKVPIIKDTLICKATNFTVDASVPSTASYLWTATTGGFSSTLPIVNLSTPALYRVRITLANGCVYNDSINIRNTADTAIRAKMLLTAQAYLNENVVAVNITNPAPQSSLWSVPSGAQIITQTASNLVMKFANTGSYKVGISTSSYNVCSSADSGIVVISRKDTTLTAPNQIIVREVNIGPNPSTGIYNFTIKLNKAAKVSIRIFSISGTLVIERIIPESANVTTISQQINITSSPKDTYIAVIQTANSNEVRTLIKN